MREKGFEPSRCYHHKILSLARLPVPTLPRDNSQYIIPYFKIQYLFTISSISSISSFCAPWSSLFPLRIVKKRIHLYSLQLQHAAAIVRQSQSSLSAAVIVGQAAFCHLSQSPKRFFYTGRLDLHRTDILSDIVSLISGKLLLCSKRFDLKPVLQ